MHGNEGSCLHSDKEKNARRALPLLMWFVCVCESVLTDVCHK